MYRDGKYYCEHCEEEIKPGESYYSVFVLRNEPVHKRCFLRWSINYNGAILAKEKSPFEKLIEVEFDGAIEEAKRYGRLWASLDHLKSIVTKDIMKREGWDDAFVMHLLDADEVEYRELHRKLEKILNDNDLLKRFEERDIDFLKSL